MKRLIWFLLPLMAASCSASGQKGIEVRWQRVRMDSTYESSAVYSVDSIVAAHQEGMSALMDIVIYAEDEIREARPESALSNLAADMLIAMTDGYVENDYPVFSLMNMGGIRSDFPKGAVRVYDIYSTFPFDNSLVIAQVKGKDVRRMIEGFISKNKFEALGGVRIRVSDGRIRECLIGGQPLTDSGIYNLATIDFLLDGGDRFHIRDNAVSIQETGVFVRDAAVRYFRKLAESGVILKDEKDGRITIE